MDGRRNKQNYPRRRPPRPEEFTPESKRRQIEGCIRGGLARAEQKRRARELAHQRAYEYWKSSGTKLV